MVWRRKLNLKAKFEISPSHLGLNTLSSRRFQHEFDGVNLPSPTTAAAPALAVPFASGW
jgi:hypothetical protein